MGKYSETLENCYVFACVRLCECITAEVLINVPHTEIHFPEICAETECLHVCNPAIRMFVSVLTYAWLIVYVFRV